MYPEDTYCIEILVAQNFWVGDMNSCFVRQVILRQPCPNAEKVLGSANWSLAASIMQILERIWFLIASQFICLIPGFPMIQKLDCFIEYMEWQKFKWPATWLCTVIKKGISSKIWKLRSYLFIHILELIPFFIISLLKAYDGCTILSPNIEIESRNFRRTKIPAYPADLSAYVYTYVALHICHCLKFKAIKFDPFIWALPDTWEIFENHQNSILLNQ